jgi:hypothetical protein
MPFYCSVDLRNSGFKLVPVYPAGALAEYTGSENGLNS